MLITRFMTPDGVGEVLDFMPVIEGGPTDRHRLVRQLRVARGQMKFVIELQPQFDYGRASHSMDITDTGAVFRTAGGMGLTLHISGRREVAESATAPERVGAGLRATVTLREGQTGGVVLGPISGDGHALGDDLEAADLPPHWCARRGCHPGIA
jgi:hypothetical protein